MRMNYENHVFIDGGDFLNTYPFLHLNETILKIYGLLIPDIIVTGDQECIEGDKFYEDILKRLSKRVIASNITVNALDLQDKFNRTYEGGKSLTDLSYLDEKAFDFIPKSALLNLDDNKFERIYRECNAEELLVVVYHGPEYLIEKFTEK